MKVKEKKKPEGVIVNFVVPLEVHAKIRREASTYPHDSDRKTVSGLIRGLVADHFGGAA